MTARLCLVMIVKNEGHIIKKTLLMLNKKIGFDYWVIADTGSTDNTEEEIRSFSRDSGVQGTLLNHEWKDFSTNRNMVISHAEKVSDYMFFFDADDGIEGTPEIPDPLTKNSYTMKIGHNNAFHRIVIVSSCIEWRYHGVLHETIYPTSRSVTPDAEVIGGQFMIVPNQHEGGRTVAGDKYTNDAKVLLEALEDKNCPRHLVGRYQFYLAQSYECAGDVESAIKWYANRAATKIGWTEEAYVACVRLGRLYSDLGSDGDAIKWFLKSTKFSHRRVEGVLGAINLCRNNVSDVALYNMVRCVSPSDYGNPSQDNLLFAETDAHNVFFINTALYACNAVGDLESCYQYLKLQMSRMDDLSHAHLMAACSNMIWLSSRFASDDMSRFYEEIKNDLIERGILNDMIRSLDSASISGEGAIIKPGT